MKECQLCASFWQEMSRSVVFSQRIGVDEFPENPWARRRSVCVVCNLHVRKTDAGLAKARADFRRILDRVVQFGGSFYLTYHRWAQRRHVASCYPQIADFFRLKRKYDPDQRLQSDWYRQYARMFS